MNVAEINIENSSASEFELEDHIVATSTIYDENRNVWHTNVMLMNKTNGMVHSLTCTQREDDSYFHHVLAPAYRICCRKTNTEPRIKE